MEVRFFTAGERPVHTTLEWYRPIERAPHLEQDGHRGRLELAADMIRQAIREHGIRTVSDMGAGDGGLLSLIAGEPVRAWGYDVIDANLAGALERGVDVRRGDILSPGVQWGELTVCTEVLEHLVDPHRFVARCPSRAILASSPDGESVESHYEFHTWGWDMPGYRALIEQGAYRVLRHESIGFQVILAIRE